MTIAERGEKFKLLSTRELLLPAVVILVGLASFALGRLSVTDYKVPGLTISYPENYAAMLPAAAAAQSSTESTGTGVVVASKNGTKYFYPDCAGAKAISEANRIVFSSIAEARKAGYLPAATCKALQ